MNVFIIEFSKYSFQFLVKRQRFQCWFSDQTDLYLENRGKTIYLPQREKIDSRQSQFQGRVQKNCFN